MIKFCYFLEAAVGNMELDLEMDCSLLMSNVYKDSKL